MSPDAQKALLRFKKLLASDAGRLGLVHLTRSQAAEQVGRSLGLAAELARKAKPRLDRSMTLLDVGSGAGLPAIPIATALSDWLGGEAPRVVMIEPKRKAVGFLEKALRELGIAGTVVWDTAEGAARKDWRLRGDFVTAKALASPRRALELCAPLCKIGGVIVITGRADGQAHIEALTSAELLRLGLADPQAAVVRGPDGISQGVHFVAKTSLPADGPGGGTGADT